MSINVQVVADEKQLADWKKFLGRVAKPDELNQAIAHAINRALENIRTVTAKGVQEKYTVKSKAVKQAQRLKKASSDNTSGMVRYKGLGVSLEQFRVKPGKPISWKGIPNAARRARQLSIEIERGRPEQQQGGFLQRFKSDEPRVYKRAGKSRLPILRQFGPAVAEMIENSGVAAKAQESGNETLAKRIDHEILRMLNK